MSLDTNISAPAVERGYRSSLRSAARGLWTGALTYSQFFDSMFSLIERGLTRAWYAGAEECGIKPAELTQLELSALTQAIVMERTHIGRLADFVEQHAKAAGGRLRTVMARVELWAKRAQDVASRARVLACQDKKLQWQLGATENHCTSCLKLANKVKRASQWKAADIRPQMRRLECGGWKCDCTLGPTDAPMSKGPLPRI